ncbi:MAG: HEAT repeat domain-containing protein [Pyrinomonadaceae bacterium]
MLELKLEHLIVLEALEKSNLTHGRVVSLAEIAESISKQDNRRLADAYAQRLHPTIGKILGLLRTRGLVFSLDDGNAHRFHGSTHVLQPSGTSIPFVQSRRCRVLALVREAVLERGRAVRNSDILERADVSEQVKGIPSRDITHDVLSLWGTGELTVVGRVRGENKGINLYLPADMDVDRYKPSQPLTWLDEVAQAIEAMWAERDEEAKALGLRPKPFTTGDVRARIADSPFHSQPVLKKDPRVLVNAMKHLAETRAPLLRKIRRRGQKALLWVPAGVSDEDVDFGDSYANDGERLGVAVARAVERLGRPVTVQDVKDEIERDFALVLGGDSSLFVALSDAAKETYNLYDGKGPQKHVLRRVYRVGRAGRDSYYYPEDTPQARAYVVFRQLELKWSGICPEEQLAALKTVSLPWVAKGRAMLLKYEVETFLRAITTLLSNVEIDKITERGAQALRNHAEDTIQSAQHWLTISGLSQLQVPHDVLTEIPTWTAEHLLQVVKPLYPLAQRITGTHQFIRLMYPRIRRVPNPEFESRFSEDHRKAAEFFYDRTDALLYMAKQWGGPECSLQAVLAANELGRLRDHRFVLPTLESNSFETRLAGIACLAFLWSAEGSERLRRIAVEDPDAGVRQSALWAFGFAGGQGARELLISRGKEDSSSRVREFVREALEACEGSWWMM